LGDKEEIGRLFEKAGGNALVLTNEEALERANTQITRNIPPYDVTATTCERAYILDKIITPEEQRSLIDTESLNTAAGKQDKIEELRKSGAYPEFVLVRLLKLRYLQVCYDTAMVICSIPKNTCLFNKFVWQVKRLYPFF
jgi:hypothetical protein